MEEKQLQEIIELFVSKDWTKDKDGVCEHSYFLADRDGGEMYAEIYPGKELVYVQKHGHEASVYMIPRCLGDLKDDLLRKWVA